MLMPYCYAGDRQVFGRWEQAVRVLGKKYSILLNTRPVILEKLHEVVVNGKLWQLFTVTRLDPAV